MSCRNGVNDIGELHQSHALLRKQHLFNLPSALSLSSIQAHPTSFPLLLQLYVQMGSTAALLPSLLPTHHIASPPFELEPAQRYPFKYLLPTSFCSCTCTWTLLNLNQHNATRANTCFPTPLATVRAHGPFWT